MPTKPKSRVYLAGPEVFLPDARAVGRAKCQIAVEFGFEGLFPLDSECNLDGLPDTEQAVAISRANEGLIRSADLLIANLTPFRSVSADAGTLFEVGFMRALGRPVLAYTNVPLDYRPRVEMHRTTVRLPYDADRSDLTIEDFGLSENLMIEAAIAASGGTLVRHTAPPGEALTNLDGYRACLAKPAASSPVDSKRQEAGPPASNRLTTCCTVVNQGELPWRRTRHPVTTSASVPSKPAARSRAA